MRPYGTSLIRQVKDRTAVFHIGPISLLTPLLGELSKMFGELINSLTKPRKCAQSAHKDKFLSKSIFTNYRIRRLSRSKPCGLAAPLSIYIRHLWALKRHHQSKAPRYTTCAGSLPSLIPLFSANQLTSRFALRQTLNPKPLQYNSNPA